MIALALALFIQAAPVAPAGPDAETLATLLSRPRLVHCNDIYCTHRPGQPTAVRDLTCAPTQVPEVILCRFQRARIPTPGPIDIHQEPAPLAWTSGSATLRLEAGGRWLLIAEGET